LRTEHKAKQNAESGRFHIAVSLHHLCHEKIKSATQSADETPPLGEISGRKRDNTCDEIENNSASQHVHFTNGVEISINSPVVSIFLYNQRDRDFRFGIFGLTSSRDAFVRLLPGHFRQDVAGFEVSNYSLSDATICLSRA